MKTKIKIIIGKNSYEIESVRDMYSGAIIEIITGVVSQELLLNSKPIISNFKLK